MNFAFLRRFPLSLSLSVLFDAIYNFWNANCAVYANVINLMLLWLCEARSGVAGDVFFNCCCCCHTTYWLGDKLTKAKSASSMLMVLKFGTAFEFNSCDCKYTHLAKYIKAELIALVFKFKENITNNFSVIILTIQGPRSEHLMAQYDLEISLVIYLLLSRTHSLSLFNNVWQCLETSFSNILISGPD